MASLLDIGPLTEEVNIRGTSLTVQGLTAGHLFQLFAEFPDMRKLIDRKQGSPQAVMLDLAPDLIGKIIALALGEGGNKDVEAKAKTMGASDQLAILTAVQRLSFPDGIGPFVDQVTLLMQPAMAASKSLATESAISSNSMTKSPVPSNASLQTDTPGLMRGHARRAN